MNILEIIGIKYFKNGAKIQIKKENRGKFTDYCKGEVTQECIDKAKKSNNPILIKRATFAENSRKWTKKHNTGGIVNPETPSKVTKEAALTAIKNWDVKNNLRHAEFKQWVLDNPDAFWNEFHNYQTHLRNGNFAVLASSVTSYDPRNLRKH